MLDKKITSVYAVFGAKRIAVVSIAAFFSLQWIKSDLTLENSDNVQNEAGSWWWQWQISIGLGVYLFTTLKWNFVKKTTFRTGGPIEVLMVGFYCSLPFRIASRVWGGFANLKLPVFSRVTIYTLYASICNANLDEVSTDLTEFPSLSDFFARSLKPNARVIDRTTNLISPSDGRVIHFGPVTSCRVEQVKGITYNLQHFLGESSRLNVSDNSADKNNTIYDDYVTSLLMNKNNILYQLTVYLAPGDYHRFHSPTDWTIKLRRHFQGKLLSVNPRIVSWLPDLFSQNERVVYVGEWAGGFMAYAAVGATNVGSIRVYKDRGLVTNTNSWPRGKCSEDARFEALELRKGELFGEFRMGSTIVMLFEAPRDFGFSVEVGQAVKMGQGLTRAKAAD